VLLVTAFGSSGGNTPRVLQGCLKQLVSLACFAEILSNGKRRLLGTQRSPEKAELLQHLHLPVPCLLGNCFCLPSRLSTEKLVCHLVAAEAAEAAAVAVTQCCLLQQHCAAY
jgi:hypothetical protein